jgi:hypothetical protein
MRGSKLLLVLLVDQKEEMVLQFRYKNVVRVSLDTGIISIPKKRMKNSAYSLTTDDLEHINRRTYSELIWVTFHAKTT